VTWRLTPAEQRALAALDPAIPRHPRDLFCRDRVRFVTLHRIEAPLGDRPALARRLHLKPATTWRTPYWDFFVLTPEGVAARKAAQP